MNKKTVLEGNAFDDDCKGCLFLFKVALADNTTSDFCVFYKKFVEKMAGCDVTNITVSEDLKWSL